MFGLICFQVNFKMNTEADIKSILKALRRRFKMVHEERLKELAALLQKQAVLSGKNKNVNEKAEKLVPPPSYFPFKRIILPMTEVEKRKRDIIWRCIDSNGSEKVSRWKYH